MAAGAARPVQHRAPVRPIRVPEPRSRRSGTFPVGPEPPTRDPAAPPRRPAGVRRSNRRTPPRGSARWTEPGAVAAQEAQRARSGGGELADPSLSSARLLRPAKRPPQSGWRRFVYVLSGRMINPGESPADVRRRELTARVNQPLLGCYKIAMLSLKGGVGKTTITATLGRHVLLAARRPRRRRRRQPRPRHAQPEDPAGDQRHRAAPAARRPAGRAATPTCGPTPRRGPPGWRCSPASRTRRSRRRSARTTTGAPSTCWSTSTTSCSPTAAPD